jgi:predicted ATPase
VDVAERARELLARSDRDSSVRLWELARDAAEHGATQDELVAVFQGLRHGADEEHEDRLLEILDFITGWCHSRWRLFP